MLRILQKLIDSIFPCHCLLCSRGSETLVCDHCAEYLPILTSHCRQCGFQFAMPEGVDRCGQCVTKPKYIDKFYGLWTYDNPVNYWLQQLKYQKKLIYGKLCAEQLITRIQSWYQDSPLPEIILPVPMHPKRLRYRGYNQAVEIAKPIAKFFEIPLSLNLCQKVKHTLPQATGATKHQRNNLRGSFAILAKEVPSHVAILDDIYTTGNTGEEIAKVLKLSGVKQIDFWCCARTQIRQK